jgi:hypothetical protein
VEQQTDNHSGGIRIVFAAASAAMTEPPGDDEETERRRRSREETSGQLARFRRWSTRPYISPRNGFRAAGTFPKTGRQQIVITATPEIPAGAYDHATAFLAETLDCMNPYYDEGEIYPAEFDADCQPAPDYPSLQL